MTGRVVLTCIDTGPGELERAHLSYCRHPLASRGKILHPLSVLLFQISWSVNKGTDTGHCFLFLGRRSHNAVYNLMINRIYYSGVIMVKVKPLILLSKARTSAWTDLCDPLTQVRDTQQHNRSWHCTVQHTDQDADINDRSPAPGSCQQIWSVHLIIPQSKKYHRQDDWTRMSCSNNSSTGQPSVEKDKLQEKQMMNLNEFRTTIFHSPFTIYSIKNLTLKDPT